MTQLVMPGHLNARGSLFGGIVVQWIDVAAAVAAMRHAGTNAVTASIDSLEFLAPIRLGDVVLLQAQPNYAGRTSMEIGCRVEAEDPLTHERRYCTKAYLTFVALDRHERPTPVPALIPETEEERRRYQQAKARSEARKSKVRARADE